AAKWRDHRLKTALAGRDWHPRSMRNRSPLLFTWTVRTACHGILGNPSHPRDMSPPPLSLLRKVFGFDAFRGEQAAIVSHLVEGGDALVLMPTGGGKSLCYQLPA